MEDVIRAAVLRQFPELSGGYHLPRFGRVVAVPDAPAAPGLCDDFRPRFAADVEVLLPNGEPDPDLPVLQSLPLPVPNGGQESGMFAFPEEGTTVVVCFAYGLPSKPYVQQVLPHGLSLPSVPKGDQLWQHSAASQQRVDADGNWLRQTDGRIRDQAVERQVEALENAERYQSHQVEVDDHATETVGGVKTLEALGALKLLSGGGANLAAVDDLNQASGRDMNLVVGQRCNATVGGNMEERIQGLRLSVAALSQHLEAPKTWLGSGSVNVLQVLCDLLDLVQEMNTDIASHVHASSPPPANAGLFAAKSAESGVLATRLKAITS
ncbi:hypothetical protein [Pseudomonas tohonis]|uniref:hypothetical protein n=1 Tax=Pseudomonas tohonis TaxID=2725477 RepID=UPI0022EFF7DC|nr:hypothetical protein [Pseudomonas tohonis]